MLDTVRSYLALHMLAAISSFTLFCRRPWSVVLTGLVIASAMALPVLFFLFAGNLAHITEGWQQGGRISLYLKPSSGPKEEEALLKKIRGLEGVASALYKTKAENLSDLQKQEGMQDIMRYLPENPLPSLIEVVPAASINAPEKMQALFERLKALPQVALGRQDWEWVNRANAIYHFISKIAEATALLLGFAVVLIVANTLGLIVQNRREEIEVMKLVGARDSLILRPFLYLGLWYGTLGAIFTILLVNIFMLRVNYIFKELLEMYQLNYNLIGLTVKQAYQLLFVTAALGWLGAMFSAKRQLRALES